MARDPPQNLDQTLDVSMGLAAFWLILLNLSVLQASNCKHLKEKCRISNDECEGLWNTTQRICEFSGFNCQLRNLLNCKSTITYLTDRYPEFKACTCSENIYCSVKKLLGMECIPEQEQNVPTGPLKQEMSIIQKSFMHHPRKFDTTLSGKANDCILAKQLCKENHNCFSLYENFKSQCIHPQECTLGDAVQSCLTAWSELRKTVMGNCVCLNSTKRKCIKVWNSIYNNTCLQHAKERHISKHSEDKKDFTALDQDSYDSQVTINLEWDKSSLKDIEYEGPMSCLTVAALCIGDSVCNKYLAVLMKSCPENGNACTVKDCHKTIRSFYESMPFNVSQMLAFCDCDQTNEDCQRAVDVLHSRSCTVATDIPISCLHVVNSCLDNELCRERYGAYQSKCWEHASRCHNERNCLLGLIKEDLTCSASEECRAAHIGTLGTKLQTSCTCNIGLDYEEQHLCDLYFHILNGKYCLKRITARNIHASYSDTQEEQLPKLHTYQSDALIHIIAYTSGSILISVIILLTLLQTRACQSQKKGNVPRRNASESLIN
ncbi:GDNF family receptor alpha-like [Mantella aurantiaca]